MSRKRLTPDEQQRLNMRNSLRTLRARVRSLERQNKRLLAEDYQVVAEREIHLLTERVRDLEDRWEEAETALYRLQQQIRSAA